MDGKVTVWYMTPEELEAYKKKHPPVPADQQEKRKTKGHTFVNVFGYGDRARKLAKERRLREQGES